MQAQAQLFMYVQPLNRAECMHNCDCSACVLTVLGCAACACTAVTRRHHATNHLIPCPEVLQHDMLHTHDALAHELNLRPMSRRV